MAMTLEPRRCRFAVAAGALLLLALFGASSNFCGSTTSARQAISAPARGLISLQAEAKDYWEGEWICADCGYIYNERSFGQKFEELQTGFKCPQCAAPRRRFARKLGDKIGTTLDGGDSPILIFSAACLLLVLAISYYALNN
mmetsp:Transcript_154739/g.496038  ORF Transcript_154739/g.496038 Transcript_154739/m.496038 type:complete len:142 (-) Transcript_154739:112-537(-)